MSSDFLTFLSTFRGVNAIVYMVDAADMEKIEASRNELHNLLEKPQFLNGSVPKSYFFQKVEYFSGMYKNYYL